MELKKGLFGNIRQDLSASIVVFFVAMPLCLGIALASGAPLFSGIIAGIIGGIVVGSASGSPLGVSGPAAGLAVVVLTAIGTLGSFQAFLVAVFLGGILQIIMGYLRLGIIAYYFPTSVIKGMLSGIGLIIILKQIPHALGYDANYEGNLSFQDVGDGNTFSSLVQAFDFITPGALLISVLSLILLVLWENILSKKHRIFQLIQGPVFVVFLGILFNQMYKLNILPFSLEENQVVQIPVSNTMMEFIGQFTFPDWSALSNPQIYITAMVLALVASLETLLCVEATDKMDPYKRITPTNRELKAQGLGSMLSGLIGGLPITQVIVRSSTNIAFGGRTKLSAILHGFFLLISAITIPELLNLIPLATLAAILFVVGYKLAKPSLFKSMYHSGWNQFVPFVATVIGILLTDLLQGIAIGMVIAIFYILRGHYRNPYVLDKENLNGNETSRIILAEEVSFLNKGSILQTLDKLPDGTHVIIDGNQTKVVDHDIIEIIKDFIVNAQNRDIRVSVKGATLLQHLSHDNNQHLIMEDNVKH